MAPCLYIYCLSDFFRTGKCFRSHICTIQSDMHGYTLAIPLLYHCMCLLHPISSISLVYTSYMAYIMIDYVLYALEFPSRYFSVWYISVYFIYHMLYQTILAYQNAILLYRNAIPLYISCYHIMGALSHNTAPLEDGNSDFRHHRPSTRAVGTAADVA